MRSDEGSESSDGDGQAQVRAGPVESSYSNRGRSSPSQWLKFSSRRKRGWSGGKKELDAPYVLYIDSVPVSDLLRAVSSQFPCDDADAQTRSLHDRLAKLHVRIDLDPVV